MKHGKTQKSKWRFQDLCSRVHDHASSFVLSSFTMQELRNQQVSIGEFFSTEYDCWLCTVKDKKREL